MPRQRLAHRTTTTANGTRVTTTKLVPAPELEWKLQAAAVRRLKSRAEYNRDFTIAGDMNAARRSSQEAIKAKATGIAAGDPDLRVYLCGGRLGMIEFKAARGRLSPEQIERHAVLRSLGHTIEVVKAKTEQEAADLTEIIVLQWLAANDNGRMAA